MLIEQKTRWGLSQNFHLLPAISSSQVERHCLWSNHYCKPICFQRCWEWNFKEKSLCFGAVCQAESRIHCPARGVKGLSGLLCPIMSLCWMFVNRRWHWESYGMTGCPMDMTSSTSIFFNNTPLCSVLESKSIQRTLRDLKKFCDVSAAAFLY